jgi:AhpD family alkylhydroperoxidase
VTPRLEPGTRRDLGLPIWVFTRIAARATGGPPPNIFLTLGRNRRLFRAWLWFAGRLMPGGRLPRRETELVILRVAHLRDSEYERNQHVRIGRRAGLTDEEIARIADGPGAPGWSERDRLVLTAVDELHADGDLTDATWRALSAILDDQRLIEFVFLVGHYEMLATVLHTLRVQPEAARA